MYDYQGAISAGANPDDVVKYLAGQTGYNADGALKAGANRNDVLAYMAKLPTGASSNAAPAAPAPAAPGLGARLASDTNAHAANIVQDLSQKPTVTGALDVAGNVAGEVGDFFSEPLKSAFNGLVDASGAPHAIRSQLSDAAQSVADLPPQKA